MSAELEKQAVFGAIGAFARPALAAVSKFVKPISKAWSKTPKPIQRAGKEFLQSGVAFPLMAAPVIAGVGTYGAIKNAPKQFVGSGF